MPRSLLFIAPLAAIIVAVGALLLVGSGGRTQVPSPAPSVAPIVSPSAAPSPSPSSSSSPGPSAYPLGAGEAWIVLGGTDRATLIRPDGTGGHDLLKDLGISVSDPTWSPDGQQLVWEGNGPRGSQLWIADADGTGAHQLTPTPSGCPDGTCIEALNPAWSPDGRTIAYIAPQHDNGSFTRTALMLVDVATGATTEVYGTTDTGLARPSWSPDSTTIALEIDHYDGLVEASPIKDTVIATIDPRSPGGTPRTITKPSLLAGYPTWHPTDDIIVVRTNRLDNSTLRLLDEKAASNVYTVHPDGSGLTMVTKNAVGGDVVRAPSWTPEGQILYTAFHPPTQEEFLRVIDADGSNDQPATGSTTTFGQGRWRPAS